MPTSTFFRFLLSWLAILVFNSWQCPLVQAQTTKVREQAVARPEGTGQVALSGPGQGCLNIEVDFTAIGSYSSWTWESVADAGNASLSDNGTFVRGVPTSGGYKATYRFSSPGTYTVSVDVGTSSASRVITVIEPISGVITTVGSTAQLSATSATICLGSTLQLVPPANSTNWSWSGANVTMNSSNGVATVQPVAENNTYSLTYTIGGTPCQVTSTFVVNTASAAGKVEVLNNDPYGENWCYGTGPIHFVVKNPDPLRVYSWYDSPGSTTSVGTGPSWTTNVTQSKSY